MAHGHRPPLTLSLVVLTACGVPGSDPGSGETEASTAPASVTGNDDGSQPNTSGGESSGGETSRAGTDTSSTGIGASTGTEGGASSSGGGETGAAPDYATPYFPLQVGLRWSYRLTRTDGSIGANCIDNGDIHVMTVTEENGGVFTRTEDPSCYFDVLAYRIEPPYVDVNSGAWYRQLLLPPEDGATWAAGGASGATYVWDEHHASYSVEAGTFEDCWRRKQQGYDVWEIYCRDVGMVESFYDAWGSNTRSELISFES